MLHSKNFQQTVLLIGLIWLLSLSALFYTESTIKTYLIESSTGDVTDFIENMYAELRDDESDKYIDGHKITASIIEHNFKDEEFFTEDWYCIALVNESGDKLKDELKNHRIIEDNYYQNFKLYQRKPDPSLAQSNSADLCIVTRQALEDDGYLLVGVSFKETYLLLNQLRKQVLGFALLITVLVIFSMFYLGRLSLNKLKPINQLCDDVQKGNLQLRLSAHDSKDEFDQLSLKINAMMDQLVQHVDGVKHLSDNIAHDLKTPVTRLRGQLDLLQRMDEKDNALIEAIIGEADQLIAIFNSLLRISQLENKTFKQHFKDINIDLILLDAMDLYEPAFNSKNVNCQLDIDPGLTINGDADLWIQAFANVLDNALKYSDCDGVLKVQAKYVNDRIQVVIHDSGTGIPRIEQDKVFERFYRLSKHRNSQGSGLGLSLVAAVCEQHNATVTLSNEQGLVVSILI